jgi:hypothetical protein
MNLIVSVIERYRIDTSALPVGELNLDHVPGIACFPFLQMLNRHADKFIYSGKGIITYYSRVIKTITPMLFGRSWIN